MRQCDLESLATANRIISKEKRVSVKTYAHLQEKIAPMIQAL